MVLFKSYLNSSGADSTAPVLSAQSSWNIYSTVTFAHQKVINYINQMHSNNLVSHHFQFILTSYGNTSNTIRSACTVPKAP